MKQNKSEMIRNAIRHAGEALTVEEIMVRTGMERGFISTTINYMARRGWVFINGTRASTANSGPHSVYAYELTEFIGSESTEAIKCHG